MLFYQLIDQKNLQKILKFAVEILVGDEYADNIDVRIKKLLINNRY